MSTFFALVILFVLFCFPFLLYFYYKKVKQFNELYNKYKDIIDLEKHKSNVIDETDDLMRERNRKLNEIQVEIDQLRKDYLEKRQLFENLIREVAIYEDKSEIISHGLYKPHFDFDTSDEYKEALLEIRESCKEMIKSETAASASVAWHVNGSYTEGKKQTKHYIKLMLRAFNGECDAMIADVRWNNISKMEERIAKVHDAINKLGETHYIKITNDYYRLKLQELQLTHEYRDKTYQEKQEQKRIQEQIREEEKVQREIEKALRDSEDEEKRYTKALEQAKKELEKAQGEQLQLVQARMEALQKELENAQSAKQRALSLAQQTKVGHVYVISNIGSFGESVFKVGMTRRLDPMDRVKELGDASVPFEFDVHAIVYSENAPELEKLLHKNFDHKRVNLVNNRKEFFEITLDEIEQIVKKHNGDVQFTKAAEAREYRESMKIKLNRQNTNVSTMSNVLDSIPQSI
ncbi:PF13250 domain protein [Leptospira interrogans serovar Zanoni str. LT2156]|uniref:PF13250 domain protein n=1 Tax=Leptospira interrogans serovar Zanoni str. LT2156 TaxID=1001601 RepID=M6HFY4_LEPIR|nr:PF13250 domain protein [Leptospira interrogans serovar Zanoni str. LT2156]